MRIPTVNLDDPAELTKHLKEAPSMLVLSKRQLKTTQRAYDARKLQISIEALTRVLFDGKPATNDKQRDLAVKMICADDPELAKLQAALDEAQERMLYWSTLAKNVRLLARLHLKGIEVHA
jgi:hypothetical protein